jgi:hypothetical protein
LERSKAGGTKSQQAAVHSWLATNAQQQQLHAYFKPKSKRSLDERTEM